MKCKHCQSTKMILHAGEKVVTCESCDNSYSLSYHDLLESVAFYRRSNASLRGVISKRNATISFQGESYKLLKTAHLKCNNKLQENIRNVNSKDIVIKGLDLALKSQADVIDDLEKENKNLKKNYSDLDKVFQNTVVDSTKRIGNLQKQVESLKKTIDGLTSANEELTKICRDSATDSHSKENTIVEILNLIKQDKI